MEARKNQSPAFQVYSQFADIAQYFDMVRDQKSDSLSIIEKLRALSAAMREAMLVHVPESAPVQKHHPLLQIIVCGCRRCSFTRTGLS